VCCSSLCPIPTRIALIAVNHLSQQAGFKTEWASLHRSTLSIASKIRHSRDIGAYDGDELDVNWCRNARTCARSGRHGRNIATNGLLARFLGRLFTRQDDAPGAAQTVVLTYPYWQQRFGGASSVIGRSITVGGVPREIIGVSSPTLPFPRSEKTHR